MNGGRFKKRAWRGLKPPVLALGLAVGLAVGLLPALAAQAQEDRLLDRITNEKMVAFEQRLQKDIDQSLRRYLVSSQYVLSVRVVWDRNAIPVIESKALSPDRYKLPGFPIFVKTPSALPEEGTPSFNRLVVKVLLDETLPEYYERFVRKLVPIVARFDQKRGDQVLVLKETFPEVQKGKLPGTIPEGELMEKLSDEMPAGAPMEPEPQAGGYPPPAATPQGPGMGEAEKARIAYEEGRYNDALSLVQGGFQKSVTNRDRSLFLSMEGSVYYTLKNQEAAKASWRRSLAYDPGNMEVQKILRAMEQKQEGAGGNKP